MVLNFVERSGTKLSCPLAVLAKRIDHLPERRILNDKRFAKIAFFCTSLGSLQQLGLFLQVTEIRRAFGVVI